ncbi:MAG: MYXO-CTERM sorting domain-containing protein [Kofleriaceae bacterium]
MNAATASAWTIGSQLDPTGCHERITTTAFRASRAMFATAPALAPTADEQALIDSVLFVPPDDFKHDLAAMSLLLGLRDNDLKGHNPLESLQLVQVHGNPDTQFEHCIRGANDDGAAGDQSALVACRAFIHERFGQALEGLDANGAVDASNRMPLAVYVNFAGRVDPMLPTFYVRLGQAVHALEDSFTHTFRSSDGKQVTVVMNWIDYVSTNGGDPERDGPFHLMALDHCEKGDPLVERNFENATDAATKLIEIAMDPGMGNADKQTAVDALLDEYLTYSPGCDASNQFCNAPEPQVPYSGCNAAGGGAGVGAAIVLLALLARRRRVIAVTCALASPALAQPVPQPTQPAPVTDAPPTAPAPVTDAPPTAPALPATPDKPADAAAVQEGHEPKRDEKTPTVQQVEQIREDKKLGSPYGFYAALGGSFVHGALSGDLGFRYRLNERWTIGIDGEWNPWITSASGPLQIKAGSAMLAATVIHRYPMKLDRVNLRTTFSLGASTVLFDVYGAPSYDIGPYVAFAPLGIDYDFGNSVRLVFDPLGVSVPIPHAGDIPLYYEQFRTMIGIQIGG